MTTEPITADDQTEGSSKWGAAFPPSSCNAWEDCYHDGVCHDPNGCGAPSQNYADDEGGVP